MDNLFFYVSVLQVLKECIPSLIGHLRDPHHDDIILDILIEISDCEPQLLANLLPILKEIGENFPSLTGQLAKIYGAVGHIDEVWKQLSRKNSF